MKSEYIFVGGSSSVGNRARSKLLQYQREGIPDDVARVAWRIVGYGGLFNIESDAFRGGDGSVAVAFHAGEDTVEIVVEPGSHLTMFVERGLGFDYEYIEPPVEGASTEQVLDRLERLATGGAWNSSGSSSHVIAGISVGGVSRTSLSSEALVRLLARPTGDGGYPYSKSSAPAGTMSQMVAFAST